MTKIRKILSFVMIFALCLSVISFSARGTSESELRSKIDEADKRIQQAQKELQEAVAKKASAEEQKKIIDDQISVIVSNIIYINNQIESANKQIAEKEEEIIIAQKKLDENKEYFKKRVVSMYKSGTSTQLEMLFTAENISDFFNRADMLQYVVKNDKKIVDEMTAARDAVIEAKIVIEERKKELEEAKRLAVEQKRQLDSALAKQQEIVNQLAKDVKINQDAAKKAQQEKDELNRQLERELAGIKDEPGGSAYSGGKMAWPVPNGGRITSTFGYRTYPAVGHHTGLDIAIAQGNPIVAAEAGTVIRVIHGTTGYGKYLMVNHGNGTVTLYAHTSKIVVSEGQRVERGQKIAEIGSTGFSTGPHLHFEVRINGKAVNPIGYIT